MVIPNSDSSQTSTVASIVLAPEVPTTVPVVAFMLSFLHDWVVIEQGASVTNRHIICGRGRRSRRNGAHPYGHGVGGVS